LFAPLSPVERLGASEVAVKSPYLGVLFLIAAIALGVGAKAASQGGHLVGKSGAADGNSSTNTAHALSDLLLAKEKSLPEAQKRKDTEYFKSIVTDDFLEVGPDAKVYSRDEMLEALNVVNLQDFSMYDAQVLPLTDSAAVVTYNVILRMNVGADRAPRYQHLSSVWVKQGADWKLKFQQATAAQ